MTTHYAELIVALCPVPLILGVISGYIYEFSYLLLVVAAMVFIAVQAPIVMVFELRTERERHDDRGIYYIEQRRG